MFKTPYYLSLRKGELPEAGISEGHPAKMYVVFGTDNPANCKSFPKHGGPCANSKNDGRRRATAPSREAGRAR